jgi:hypothetical protein
MAEHCLRPNSTHELDIVYQNMTKKWLNCPEQWRWDTALVATDARVCKAIYSYGDWRIQPETWSRLQKWLEPLLSSGVSYAVTPDTQELKGHLHFTFHQITGFMNAETMNQEKDTLESRHFKDYMMTLEGLQIQFRGLVLTPTGLALRGFPANDMQTNKLMRLRDTLGAFLQSQGIEFQPPYCNDICHSTLFRWTQQPTDDQIKYIQEGIHRWEEAYIGSCRPTVWSFGYGTLLMSPEYVIPITTVHIPLQIAHRGLTRGPDSELENNWDTILQRSRAGFYSEVDIWFLKADNKWYIGHDVPHTAVLLEDILNPFFWLHAKNKYAFEELLKKRYQGYPIQAFWHTTEDYCLTTNVDCIVYPGKPLLEYSTFMMPENSGLQDTIKASYICSDCPNTV